MNIQFHTPQAVAEMFGIDSGKVLGWIRRGELTAINVAHDTGGRPRWRVSEAALSEFLQRRQSIPPAPLPKRQKPAGGIQRKYYL